MKIYKCDSCKKEIEIKDYPQKYPKAWFMVKLYSTAQSKGGTSKGYHLCKKCKERIFGK